MRSWKGNAWGSGRVPAAAALAFNKAGPLRRVAPAGQQLVQQLLLALHRRPGINFEELQGRESGAGGREASGQQVMQLA